MSIELCALTVGKPSADIKGFASSKMAKKEVSLVDDKATFEDAFSGLLAGLNDGESAVCSDVALSNVPASDVVAGPVDPQAGSPIVLLTQQNWIPVNTVVPISILPAKNTTPKVDLAESLAEPANNESAPKIENASGNTARHDTLSAGKLEPQTLGLHEVWAKAVGANAPKDKVYSESRGASFNLEDGSVVHANVSQFDKKVTAEVSLKLDGMRPAVVQTTLELATDGKGAPAEFRREKVGFTSKAVDATPTFNGGAEGRSLTPSFDVSLSDVSARVPLADQTPGTYWLSGDMKNAEMKLDGIGEGSVEVSISLHGNQTHVSFRTDEDQTRAALAEAGPTLKDMLHREGLELSGVSVGLAGSNLSSGTGGGQEARSKLDYRAFKVGTHVESEDDQRLLPLGRRQSGNLDVFV